MFLSLLKKQYHNLQFTNFPIIDAVISGTQEGNIFISKKNPQNFFIIHRSGFSFLKLDDEHKKFLDFVKESPAIPQYFHISDAPKQIIELINKDESFSYKLRNRMQMRLYKNTENKFSMPQGFFVKKISANNLTSLKIFNLDLENKFWNKKDFLQNAIGFVVFDKEYNPASICYSASIANGLVEIDIVTLQQFQKMSLATIAAQNFIAEILSKGLYPSWDCFEENHASVRTAQKLGFKPVKKYKLLSIFIHHEKGSG